MEDENIEDFLLCPTCSKIPSDDIYQCKKGHTICNQCSKSVDSCPQCNEPYDEEKIRNIFLEKIINSRTTGCPNKELGCLEILWKKGLEEHLDDCSFRDVTYALCDNLGYDCDFVVHSRNPSEAVEHFRNKHEVTCLDSNAAFIILENFVATPLNKWSIWTPVVLQCTYGGYSFKVHVFSGITGKNQVALIGMHLSAGKSEAAQFVMDVTINSKLDKILPLTWTLPLISLADAEATCIPVRVQGDLLAEYYASGESIKLEVSIRHQSTPRDKATSIGKESVSTFNIPAANGGMEEGEDGFVHEGVDCDACDAKPIKGVRYNCLQCDNFDLCESCREREEHSHHLFLAIWNEKQAIALEKHKWDPKAEKPKALLRADVKIGEETTKQKDSGKQSESDSESSSSEDEGNEVWKAAVQEHNKYRRRHGVPDVTGDPKIHAVAQNYANYLASNGAFQHSGNRAYGENLAANGTPKDKAAAARNAVQMWYDEVKHYNYGYPGFSSATGHFTQVVWKKSTKIGIGVAWSPRKNWWVTVCNYSPPGNMMGAFPENVPRPK